MRLYINDFINTLSERRQRQVSSILNEVLVSRDNQQVIADRLASSFTKFSSLTLPEQVVNSRILSTSIYTNFRDAQLNIGDIFAVSLMISNLIDSHSASLTSEVKQIEDELIALEKLAQNYAFLLGDSKAYNYAFLESFSDELGRETDFNFSIPDRAAQTFGPAETATVRTDEGVLCLSTSGNSYSLSASILKGNATGFVAESTDLDQALIKNSVTGWQTVIAAPNPISSSLPEAVPAHGAQMLLEFAPSQPVPASEIKLIPFADFEMELLQVYVFKSNDSEDFFTTLDSKIVLDRPITMHFPMQSITKFRVLINQPVYNRVSKLGNASESLAQKVHEEKKKQLRSNKHNKGHHRHDGIDKFKLPYLIDFLRRINLQFHVRSMSKLITDSVSQTISEVRRNVDIKSNLSETELSLTNSIPKTFTSNQWGDLNLDHILQDGLKQINSLEPWTEFRQDQKYIFSAIFSLIPDIANFLRRFFSGDKIRLLGPPESGGNNETTQVVPPPTQGPPIVGNEYEYILGFYYVGLGTSEIGLKGHFVSKVFNANGDIGRLRLKSADSNYFSPDPNLDSNQLTSIEYSVSNKPNPDSEDDWRPILPINQSVVTGERFFPDMNGVGYLRFPAQPSQFFAMYKNGRKQDVPIENVLYSANRLNIVGFKLSYGTYSPNDFVTVDYLPNEGFDTLSFEDHGFINVPLVAAYDSSGAGEGFDRTVGTNEIDLSFLPYIDQAQIVDNTTYAPIVVKLADGTIPVNQTNYSGGTQAPLTVSDSYYYVQSGNVLKFNRSVTSSFRVFYQYLQNTVRVRVVLRNNSVNYVSPKVDFFQVKALTRRSDTGAVF